MSRTTDLKGMYQEKADEIADERFGKDFYDLNEKCQLCIYNEAMQEVTDRLVMQAEMIVEANREKELRDA